MIPIVARTCGCSQNGSAKKIVTYSGASVLRRITVQSVSPLAIVDNNRMIFFPKNTSTTISTSNTILNRPTLSYHACSFSSYSNVGGGGRSGGGSWKNRGTGGGGGGGRGRGGGKPGGPKFSSPVNNIIDSFQNRRNPSPNYRPALGMGKKEKVRRKGNEIKPVGIGMNQPKFPGLSEEDEDLDVQFGSLTADVIREIQNQHKGMEIFRGNQPSRSINTDDDGVVDDDSEEYVNPYYDDRVEEEMRMMDYFISEPGSTEDLVGERRGLAIDIRTEQEREEFLQYMSDMIDKQQLVDLGVGRENAPDEIHYKKKKKQSSNPELEKELMAMMSENQDDDMSDDEEDPETIFDPNQLAFGDWSEMLIQVDRNAKLWRGGRLESYRALVIGGNLNGCGGFAVGKALDPMKAVSVASRKCKRNIFFVDRYQNNGITRDLVGKQNSCKLVIRATSNGLRGNPLVREILKRFGITNAVSKSHGNRSPYNVVRAAFKALMTHESIEEIALKRGKRLVSIDRARRLQV